MRAKKFQVFPFEHRHRCASDSTCFFISDSCVLDSSRVSHLRIGAFGRAKGEYCAERPVLSSGAFYLLRIKFPSAVPLVKLVNINGTQPTVQDILREFSIFYREMLEVELATATEVAEGTVKCRKCTKGTFERFAKVGAPSDDSKGEAVAPSREDKCPVCWGEEGECVILDCGHLIHLECLQKWFKRKNSCPLCRKCIEPCDCMGTRTAPPARRTMSRTARSTGIYRLYMHYQEITYTALIYDRDRNMFYLKQTV